MKKLKKLLKDREAFEGWKSNIAMCVYDTFIHETQTQNNLHRLCNLSAHKFLQHVLNIEEHS